MTNRAFALLAASLFLHPAAAQSSACGNPRIFVVSDSTGNLGELNPITHQVVTAFAIPPGMGQLGVPLYANGMLYTVALFPVPGTTERRVIRITPGGGFEQLYVPPQAQVSSLGLAAAADGKVYLSLLEFNASAGTFTERIVEVTSGSIVATRVTPNDPSIGHEHAFASVPDPFGRIFAQVTSQTGSNLWRSDIDEIDTATGEFRTVVSYAQSGVVPSLELVGRDIDGSFLVASGFLLRRVRLDGTFANIANLAGGYFCCGADLSGNLYYTTLASGGAPSSVVRVNPGTGQQANVFVGAGGYFQLGPITGESGRDSDADGLLDEWEENGIDLDCNGTPEITLPGANKLHKDLYVEVDAMLGRAPSDLGPVVSAFAAVPAQLVLNPDRERGITLHAKVDEVDLPLDPTWTTTNFADKFRALKSEKFGTSAERLAGTVAAKHLAYRYAVFADQLLVEFPLPVGPKQGTGKGEFNGDDFIVTLGRRSTPGGTRDEQNGTFMHELGHTLGLSDGGGDTKEFKPNYNSVMNYYWQMPGAVTLFNATRLEVKRYKSSWRLDYSRWRLPELDEHQVREDRGLQGSRDRWLPVRVGETSTSEGKIRVVKQAGSIDFDEDKSISTFEQPQNLNHISVNYVETAELQSFSGFVDWTAIKLPNKDRAGGRYAFGVTDFDDASVDLTIEDYEGLSQPTAIDCNQNGVDDNDELASGADHDSDGDGLLDSCEPLPGDADEDGELDRDDGIRLLAALGTEEGLPGYEELADLDGNQRIDPFDLYIWSQARLDANGLPPECTAPGPDIDGDGVIDSCDNCRTNANSSQTDSDSDGFGNMCDADINNNGIVGLGEVSQFANGFGKCSGDSGFNPDLDRNGNGCISAGEVSWAASQFGLAPGPSGLSCAGQPLCWAESR